jgi:anion-transporting  ArsA/GET3 family ATPase
VTRHAPTPESSSRILRNPFYRELSERFSGSFEYMAVEELCLLAERDEHDLIVLDTPPADHALELLDSPRRILALLDRRVVRSVLTLHGGPGLAGLIRRSSAVLARQIEGVAGTRVLDRWT